MSSIRKLSYTTSIILAFALFSTNAYSLKAKVAASEKENLSYKGYVEASGILLPKQQLFFQLSPGESVNSFNFKTGDQVNKGDVIFTISNVELLTKIAALEEKLISIIKQNEQYELLKIEKSQNTEMINHLQQMLDNEKRIEQSVPGYSAIDKVNALNDELFRVNSKLKMINAKLKYAKTRLGKQNDMIPLIEKSIKDLNKKKEALTVKAPFDGKIRVNTSHLSFIKPGVVFAELNDESSFIVKAELWQHQLQYINIGSKAEIYPDFYSKNSISAVVDEISPSVKTKTSKGFSRFPVILNVPNTSVSKAKLLPGMTLSIKIFGNKSASAEE